LVTGRIKLATNSYEQKTLHHVCPFDKERLRYENHCLRCPESENLWEEDCIGRTLTMVSEVKSLTKNHDYVSIKLDDETVLEVGSVYLHDGNA